MSAGRHVSRLEVGHEPFGVIFPTPVDVLGDANSKRLEKAAQIVVLDPSGRVVAKLGDFDGIDPHGSPRGLLFPASLVLSNGFVYVTNLSLDLRLFGLPQTVDSQWAASVTRHTVARIKARIPPVQGR